MSEQTTNAEIESGETTLDELNDQGAGAGASDEPTTFEPEEEDA